MRHNVSGRKLNRSPAHRKMLYRNLVTALFRHERIQTTVPKAKEARSLAEKLITFAKRGDLHARRQAARKLTDPSVLQKLFEEIGPRYAERPGGYTRILRLGGVRKGDAAEVAILELVDGSARPKVIDTKKRKRARRILEAEEKAEAKAALQEAAEERAQREEEVAAAEAAEADESKDVAPAAEPAEGDEEPDKKD
jgi:large subunit ribosomal protein L17